MTLAQSIAPQQALEMLLEGNRRYVLRNAGCPYQDMYPRQPSPTRQHPFAIILSCSDLTILPELAFDQVLGALHFIRTPGHTVDDLVLGAIEYAITYLDIRLVLVLGHQNCTTVSTVIRKNETQGHISSIMQAIEPAVKAVRGCQGDEVKNATEANVRMVVAQLWSSDPILCERVETGQIEIVGAICDSDSGIVRLL